MKKLIISACALSIIGCGSSDSFQGFNQTVPASTTSATLSGRVVDENGAPLQSIGVKVQERTTGQEILILSSNDGTFQITAPNGVYDLTLDRMGDSQVATSHYGPILTDSSKDFVLHNRGGRANDVVFGKIETVPGTAAASRELNFNPGYARNYKNNTLPESLAKVTTQADGRFEVSLGHADEAGLDLEIPDSSGSLDEWVQIDKLDKPAYVEVAVEQSGVENRLHINESPDNQLSAAQPPKTSGAVVPAIPAPFKADLYNNIGLFLSDGTLQPNATQGFQLATIIDRFPSGYDTEFQETIQDSLIQLKATPAFINWFTKGWTIYLTPKLPSNWSFTDYAGNTVNLKTKNLNGAYCRYNSTNPALRQIIITPY